MTIQFPTSPNVCFCTTKGMQLKRNMHWNVQKCEKNSPDIIGHNLMKHYQILIIFGWNISDITSYCMIVTFPTSPNVCSCTTWGKQTKQIMCWNEWKIFNKFHLSRSLGPNNQSITKFDRHKAVMTFRNVYEFKKWLVKSGLVCSKNIIDTTVNKCGNHLHACVRTMHPQFKQFSCRQLLRLNNTTALGKKQCFFGFVFPR